jgi:outer membrane protein OmpA-like peptidoglycan-associated protein
MNSHHLLPMSLVAIAIVAGCSSLPAANPRLDQARNDYSTAQSNPETTRLAAGELKEASDSLSIANSAWSKGENAAVVDHLAYVAKQRIEIAQETGRQKAAELSVTRAGAERDSVRLEARTNEANAATLRAQTSQRQADASLLNAQVSQKSAENAQRQAMEEKLLANEAVVTAEASRIQAQNAETRNLQLEVYLKDLEAKKTDRGLVITLGDVLFDTNRAELKSGGMRNIQKLAEFFKQYPQRKVVIEGFTDSTGGDARNQELSDKRAGAVRGALLDLGISADRITSHGYGEAYPVASNDNASGRQLNRRVELVVSDESGVIAAR